jgi:putative restriction endonuclease
MVARAWLVIALGEERQYGGNTGYSDEPTRLYRYDSAVANHKRVAPGDLIFVRDGEHLLGVGTIGVIRHSPAQKERSRCPVCRSTAIKKRKHLEPRWKCGRGHEFSEPNTEIVQVTAYEAEYAESFLRADGRIASEQLKKAALRPSDQLSIEEIDPGLLLGTIRLIAPLIYDKVLQFVTDQVPDAVEGEDEAQEDAPPAYVPSVGDARAQVWAAIKRRRGQTKFRNGLMKRYGPSCMMSGCAIIDVLEAAHISPFRGDADHHLDNGLLLRADLHTLFDLRLISIDPANLIIRLSGSLPGREYEGIDGTHLRIGTRWRPSEIALAAHWAAFHRAERRRCPSSRP